jgi:glyoxylase-like metal-dependent hydrolase (beta-lactamase superfamily II)
MLLDVFSDNPFATNCWIAADDEAEELVVVDPGFEAAAIRSMVARTGRRLAAVLATHGHGDHIGAVKDVCGEDVPLYIHEADELALTDQATWGAGYAAQADFRPPEVRTVRDGQVLEFGGFRIEVLHTPGHAKDLVSILLPGRIITADALLLGSCGRTDLPNSNSTRQYHTLYYVLKSLPDELLVYPGHDYKDRSHSTLGEEKENNPKMNFSSEEEFVEYMERENPGKLSPVYHLADALKANMA